MHWIFIIKIFGIRKFRVSGFHISISFFDTIPACITDKQMAEQTLGHSINSKASHRSHSNKCQESQNT